MTMCVTAFGSMLAARRLFGSLPSVGYIVLPAPASIMINFSPRRMTKLFTGMGKVPLPSASPTNCSAFARSMSTIRSSEVGSAPSLKPCTRTPPTVMLGKPDVAMSKSFPGESDHAAGGDRDGDREHRERREKATPRRGENVADHHRRQCARHLRHQRAHALRLGHIGGTDDAVHQHMPTCCAHNAPIIRMTLHVVLGASAAAIK